MLLQKVCQTIQTRITELTNRQLKDACFIIFNNNSSYTGKIIREEYPSLQKKSWKQQ